MKKLMVWLSVILMCFSLFLNGCLTNEDHSSSGQKHIFYVNDDGNTSYSRIQDALDVAENGDTVYVFAGSYYEAITMNSSVDLIGENATTTRIILNNAHLKTLDDQYSYIPNDEVGIVHIIADHCTLQGFTIINNVTTDYAYDVSNVRLSSSNNSVLQNIILNGTYGVFLFQEIKDNSISFNNISSNDNCGIYVYTYSDWNIFHNNDIFNNFYGVILKGASYNEFYKNNITGGFEGIKLCCGATNNTMYLNTFINISSMAAHDTVGKNSWDAFGMGNFWDDYTTRYPNATSMDGIWAIPYSIASDIVIDHFPLVTPYYMRENTTR